LCQVWLKLAQRFWRRRFSHDPIPFLHSCYYLPFEEDLALYLNKSLFFIIFLGRSIVFSNEFCNNIKFERILLMCS
jgi:hypothetical protein